MDSKCKLESTIWVCILEKLSTSSLHQYAIYVTGHFLLTLLLMKPLKAAAPSRVVAVSSSAHNIADVLGIDQMKHSQFTEENYSRMGSYGRSKLYNILFARELGKRLKGKMACTP
jgi:NAD(P)-dependent dehydrogenase (short-subunit alcohol dehydrogenase family)